LSAAALQATKSAYRLHLPVERSSCITVEIADGGVPASVLDFIEANRR
jgi:hypothetical protein